MHLKITDFMKECIIHLRKIWSRNCESDQRL